jgi:mitogen-activated protein kinase kinase kinase
MEGGSLFDHIKNKNNPKFNWSINLKLIKDITAGMVYLHSNDILHLDLKSLNILLNKESDQAKISDFGLSQINTITSTLSRAPSSRVAKGTTRYMACEIAKGIKPSRKSDIWSYGCVLLEFITRELPFSALPDNAIFLMLQNDSAEIPLNFNTETPQLIADLISIWISKSAK